MTEIVLKAQKYFDDYIHENEDIFHLERHLVQVERWAKRLLETHSEADEEIVMLGVYLHDIAHYPVDKNSDHAVRGEEKATEFLKDNNYPEDRIKKVTHLVRSHRCKDIQPETIEARILACADSASHLTDSMYLDIIQDERSDYALGKLERDYRDIGIFPEIQQELKPLHEAWKNLINAFMNI
ncbi:hypothetical protein A2V71_00825 [Candidatus Berkelbacteria bacterium RBG_13_40_8]|uniref:HD/PDEase domain-containing protein n=1 Tax=Candidatus Berkelbacteria bacterium RBG_13_40_8 TaxID=1797467 RepID=A0A1F5DQP0_9BACT|nr:MAG: hypothetical protein A2V71_00825 [Candidatus Berkelbacteria bacterium RBG_13_40_8]